MATNPLDARSLQWSLDRVTCSLPYMRFWDVREGCLCGEICVYAPCWLSAAVCSEGMILRSLEEPVAADRNLSEHLTCSKKRVALSSLR